MSARTVNEGVDRTIRYNCLGYPYTACEVCGAPEVRVTKSGKLHGSHLKGPRHRAALATRWNKHRTG